MVGRFNYFPVKFSIQVPTEKVGKKWMRINILKVKITKPKYPTKTKSFYCILCIFHGRKWNPILANKSTICRYIIHMGQWSQLFRDYRRIDQKSLNPSTLLDPRKTHKSGRFVTWRTMTSLQG